MESKHHVDRTEFEVVVGADLIDRTLRIQDVLQLFCVQCAGHFTFQLEALEILEDHLLLEMFQDHLVLERVFVVLLATVRFQVRLHDPEVGRTLISHEVNEEVIVSVRAKYLVLVEEECVKVECQCQGVVLQDIFVLQAEFATRHFGVADATEQCKEVALEVTRIASGLGRHTLIVANRIDKAVLFQGDGYR